MISRLLSLINKYPQLRNSVDDQNSLYQVITLFTTSLPRSHMHITCHDEVSVYFHTFSSQQSPLLTLFVTIIITNTFILLLIIQFFSCRLLFTWHYTCNRTKLFPSCSNLVHQYSYKITKGTLLFTLLAHKPTRDVFKRY